jgi:glycosyltransferase involved in cell wall biosynthesis
LKKNKFDLIHAHFGQAGFICTLQGRLPVVVTFHGSELLGLGTKTVSGRILSSLLRSISLIAAKRADEIITVSQRLSRELPWPSHIIPIGIDLSTFRPKPREAVRTLLGWSLDERSVLFVGAPTNPIKRYWLASEAVALVTKKLSNVNLHICYSQPQEHVADYMNASDVLLVTSLHEAGPLVVREALACDLPIVSVDVGDVRERIAMIDGCVICPDDKAETLARGLEYVLRRRHRIKGYTAIQDMDERLLTKRVIAVYEKVIKKNNETSIKV